MLSVCRGWGTQRANPLESTVRAWVYGTHLSKRACNSARKHHTTQPARCHRSNGRVPPGG